MQNHDYETGAAAIDYSFSATGKRYITEVSLHLSAAGGAAENFVIKHNSALGAVYDVNIYSVDMTAIQDIVWKPDGGFHELNTGDTLDIDYTNTNTRTYGLEVLYR